MAAPEEAATAAEPAATVAEPEAVAEPAFTGRKAWAMECLDAHKARSGAKVDTQTLNGGYGGFRYMTWGASYGGSPDGETLLHLAVRPECAKYPRRFEFCSALMKCGIDASKRNADGSTARDLNAELMDMVHPLQEWGVRDVLAWFLSAGPAAQVTQPESWVTVFALRGVDGAQLVSLTVVANWRSWVESKLADLTRAGLSALALEQGKKRWPFELKNLKSQSKHASIARRAELDRVKRDRRRRGIQDGSKSDPFETLAADGTLMLDGGAIDEAPEDATLASGEAYSEGPGYSEEPGYADPVYEEPDFSDPDNAEPDGAADDDEPDDARGRQPASRGAGAGGALPAIGSRPGAPSGGS